MEFRRKLTALTLLKVVGLVREAAIIIFSVGNGAADAANCYFLSSQAAIIFNGRARTGRVLGGVILAGFWIVSGGVVPFSIVVFLPFLLWPRINKAAFEQRRLIGVVTLSGIFNLFVFTEMAVAGTSILGFTVPNLFGVPFVSLYMTVAAGLLLYGVAPSIDDIGVRDLSLLVMMCAARMLGFASVAAEYQWLFLLVMRGIELIVPQWVALKRMGVGRS